jgi:DedD protein
MAKPITDEELQLKVRARHRLIGAIALVVVLVVVLPMIFDSAPRQEKSEVAIQIPAPESAPPFNPKLEPPARTEKPAPQGQPANSVARSATAPAMAPAVVTELPAESVKPADVVKKPDEHPEEKPVPPKVATATQAKVDKFVVQLGVFANPDNAKQVETRLKDNNIHYYTEVLKSPAGAVRVRAGPFASRSEAEEVRTQLKLAGLTGGVVIGE